MSCCAGFGIPVDEGKTVDCKIRRGVVCVRVHIRRVEGRDPSPIKKLILGGEE